MKKIVAIVGGGTINHVRAHLALCAPAYGETARIISMYCNDKLTKTMHKMLYLTKMADSNSSLVTNEDLKQLAISLNEDLLTKIVFWNPAICDFDGVVLSPGRDGCPEPSGKYETRLKTSDGEREMILTPSEKILHLIRKGRKDIFLVAFKTTTNATEKEQYEAGLKMMKEGSVNLVLANDLVTRKNMIITPEEAKYHVTTDRGEALKMLVEMAYLRSQLSFTRSTVVEGSLVPWTSKEVFNTLRTVVNYCIEKNAYKPFNGATVGHFACKIGENEFLTSVRKSNFNDLMKNGLVRIKTDGPDTVIAYGAKPSVGGQSQRIIFSEHEDYDCIVHFHCPIKKDSLVPIVSQREYECGSHQCGENTSRGLQRFGNLSAVMLDNHGPNIVFHHSITADEVIRFIEKNFDLSDKTGGTF